MSFQQDEPAYPKSLESNVEHPLLHYKRMLERLHEQDSTSFNSLWKRLVHDLALYHRQQRFGNTRYGRAIRN